MRIRTIVAAVVSAFSVLVLAAPAAAQGTKVDFSAGYQYFRFLEDGASNVPAGWGVSFAAGKPWVKFVGDVGGHYLDGDQLHTFQGGVEFSGTAKHVVPFARLLTGVAVLTGFNDSNAVWVLTPEAGVKIMANDHVGVQTSVGFPYLRNGDGSANGFRYFAGIVIRKLIGHRSARPWWRALLAYA